VLAKASSTRRRHQAANHKGPHLAHTIARTVQALQGWGGGSQVPVAARAEGGHSATDADDAAGAKRIRGGVPWGVECTQGVAGMGRLGAGHSL